MIFVHVRLNFISIYLFVLTLAMKLKDANYKSHWNILVYWDQWKMISDLNMFHGKYVILFYFSYKTEKFWFWKSHIFFFYLGFLSRPFTNYRTARERGGHFFNSSLPLPPDSQTLRHQLGDYYRELNSAHR